jgi:hypothetical protein
MTTTPDHTCWFKDGVCIIGGHPSPRKNDGTFLTQADMEELADEAQRGYDVEKIRPIQTRVQMSCDHCGQTLHRDVNGWLVGEDETSDCPENMSAPWPNRFGHTHNGSPYARPSWLGAQ